MLYPTDLKYSKSHEWVRMDGEIAVVGISDFAQDALGDVVFINLPAEGDAVKTAAAGEVTSGTRDELRGTTVCITHSGGYVTRYSSLQENPPISQGQQVKAGDIVGYVGTAAAEASMGPHLHFAVEKDGSLIDPKEYIK